MTPSPEGSLVPPGKSVVGAHGEGYARFWRGIHGVACVLCGDPR